MAHQGRCRCGTILTFQQGPNGYKTRCPRCNSVVRLRMEPMPKGSDSGSGRSSDQIVDLIPFTNEVPMTMPADRRFFWLGLFAGAALFVAVIITMTLFVLHRGH